MARLGISLLGVAAVAGIVLLLGAGVASQGADE